jgi:hypothetical protein
MEDQTEYVETDETKFWTEWANKRQKEFRAMFAPLLSSSDIAKIDKTILGLVLNAIRDIGLALNACHNTVTTDDVNARPQADYSWRIDHTKEIRQLDLVQEFLSDLIKEP